jgi:hypothetical protein
LKNYLFFALGILFALGLHGFFVTTEGEETVEILEIPIAEQKGSLMPVSLSHYAPKEKQELIMASYMNPEFHGEVLAFFQALTGSLEIAEVVLLNARVQNIAPALAFALCAEESAYNIHAINRNLNETVDRGLFQLNSASFPELKVEEFYDPIVNAWHGLSHLRWCIDNSGNEIAGLAMYNAGTTRVNYMGTPRSTLDYISRILSRKQIIEELFFERYLCVIQEQSIVEESVEKQRYHLPFRFSLLAPLGHLR